MCADELPGPVADHRRGHGETEKTSGGYAASSLFVGRGNGGGKVPADSLFTGRAAKPF